MSEHNETLADIVAEMRKRMRSYYYSREGRNLMRQYADRIEAAHKREVDELNSVIQAQRSAFDAEQDRQRRAAPGNAAAMREALEELVSNIEMRASAFDIFSIIDRKTFLDAKAALAATPRNCDVGTAEEQEERYLRLKKEHIDRLTRCPHVGCAAFFPDSLYWAQMPYEAKEGGAK